MLAVTPTPAAAAPGALAQALADELVLASQLLAELAFDLASDEGTLRRHLTSLQQVDRVTQMQLAIAELLRGDMTGGAGLHAVTLDEMRQRIARRMGGAA